jgi:hypothetical protein
MAMPDVLGVLGTLSTGLSLLPKHAVSSVAPQIRVAVITH